MKSLQQWNEDNISSKSTTGRPKNDRSRMNYEAKLKPSDGVITLGKDQYCAIFSYVFVRFIDSIGNDGLRIGEVLSSGYNGLNYVEVGDLVLYHKQDAWNFSDDIYCISYTKLIAKYLRPSTDPVKTKDHEKVVSGGNSKGVWDFSFVA